MNKKHFAAKSSGLLGADLGQLRDDEEEQKMPHKHKRAGSRIKKKKNKKQLQRAKSMAVMPKMQEMPMSKINNDVNFDRYTTKKLNSLKLNNFWFSV